MKKNLHFCSWLSWAVATLSMAEKEAAEAVAAIAEKTLGERSAWG